MSLIIEALALSVSGYLTTMLSAFLFLYYLGHAQKISSSFFKTFSLLFIPYMLAGAIWMVIGILSLVGFLAPCLPYIPPIMLIIMTISTIFLTRFVKSTYEN